MMVRLGLNASASRSRRVPNAHILRAAQAAGVDGGHDPDGQACVGGEDGRGRIAGGHELQGGGEGVRDLRVRLHRVFLTRLDRGLRQRAPVPAKRSAWVEMPRVITIATLRWPSLSRCSTPRRAPVALSSRTASRASSGARSRGLRRAGQGGQPVAGAPPAAPFSAFTSTIPSHLVRHQDVDAASLPLGIFLGVEQHQRVALPARDVLRAAHHFREEGVRDVGYDHAQDHRLLELQVPGHDVGGEGEGLDGGHHTPLRVAADRLVIEEAGDGGGGTACQPCDVSNRRHWERVHAGPAETVAPLIPEAKSITDTVRSYILTIWDRW